MRVATAAVLAAMLVTGAAHAQAPVVVDHQVIGLRRIDFVFSVPMERHSVEQTEHSSIHPAGSPGDAIEPFSIFLDADGVTMKVLLKEPMAAGGAYVLALGGVESAAEVPNDEGYEYPFTATDLVPPGLGSVAFLEPDAIDLVFSEDIAETEGETPSNYLLYETAVPANIAGFAEVRMRGVYDRVFLRLESALNTGTQYTLEASGLHDPCGNPLPPGSALTFTHTGVNDRALAGLYVDDLRHNTAIDGVGFYAVDMYIWARSAADAMRMVLFSIDYPPNIIPEDIELISPWSNISGDVFNGIAISSPGCIHGWTIVARQRLVVAGCGPSIVEMSSYPSTPISAASPWVLECRNEQLPQISMRISTNIEINAPDARPVMLDASFSGYTLIDILFNVPMDGATAEDLSNYEVFETAAPANSMPLISAGLLHDDRTVRLIASTDLVQGIEYTARVTGVENDAGTAVYQGSEIVFTALDAEGPHLLSAAMTGERIVELLFDELLCAVSASSMSHYEIAESANPSSRLSLYSAELLGDGVTVRLTTHSSPLDGVDYSVGARYVEDLRGNEMRHAETAGFTADDVYPPRVSRVVPLPGGAVRAQFDQETDEATGGDPARYSIRNPAVAIASVAWEGSSVLIETSGMIFDDSYSLYYMGIEDPEGNAFTEERGIRFDYLPQDPYPQVGLWSDLGRTDDFVQACPFQPFEFYVWCMPGPDGIYAIEYALAERSLVDFEYGIIGVANGPDAGFSIGDPLSGISIAMNQCQNNWFWVSRCTAFLIRGDGYLEVVPHPLAGGPNACLCVNMRPVVQLDIVNMLSFQTVVATLLQSSSAEYAGGKIAVRWTLSEVDEGVEFSVLREEGGGGFRPAPAREITREGLSFEYLDAAVEIGETYAYRIVCRDGETSHTLFETEAVEVPAAPFALEQNHPNPFNPSTEIRFSLPSRCAVRLEIFDTAGRLIRVLRDGAMDPGAHAVLWDGTNGAGRAVGSGVYFYRLRAGKDAVARKMVLLR